MGRILEFSRSVGIPVVEDAAQAIGTVYRDGRSAGSMGVMGCLSFYPTKNLGAVGDGGMVVTSDEALAHRLRLLRNHGAEQRYFHKIVGGNFRLDGIQGAVLLVKLKYLDGWHRARQEHAEHYRRLLSQTRLIERGDVGLPENPHASAGARTHIYNQFVIRARSRDALREFLTGQGVGTEIYYPVPFHLQECFRHLGYRPGEFPESERAARETLALPIYPELTHSQQEYVVEQLGAFYRRGR
jgi:dTDP-4-amino-4,6-dideoxygalactose transaminase